MKDKKIYSEQGVAIILVISVLAVLTGLGAAFLFSMRLETIRGVQFRDSVQASYIAEAGLAHAKALLKKDKQESFIDTHDEAWYTAFRGKDIDNDEDGTKEAEWMNLVNNEGDIYGRYAVTVTDEASRINVNTAGYHNEAELKVTEGYSPFEVSISKFFSALGIPGPAGIRDDILSYRYGGNYPGENSMSGDDNNNNIAFSYDGLDNDADGIIDEPSEGVNEPQEFIFYRPYGDDVPFYSVYDLMNINTVKPYFGQVRPYMTADSFDFNVDKDRAMRTDLNQASVLEINNALLASDLTTKNQLAVNIVDYRDADNESTVLVADGKTYYGVEAIRINELMVNTRRVYHGVDYPGSLSPAGNWVRDGNHYKNSHPSLDEFRKGVWKFTSLPPGTYYLRVFGRENDDIVGDVKVAGITQTSMQNGDVFVEPVVVGPDGIFTITVYNKEIDKGESFTTYFRYVMLYQSPDSEYIELLNISNKSIDVSGWTIEGLRENDLVATIPEGSVIESFGYLVLAIDKDDAGPFVPLALRENGISFLDTWNGTSVNADEVVQLFFSDAVRRTDDVIANNIRQYDACLRLKTGDGKIVDRVEYASTMYYYVSRERGNPASVKDFNGDTIFDAWTPSFGFSFANPVGTPTAVNNNLSMSGHVIGGHNTEVFVKNGEFANVGELPSVSTESYWGRVSLNTLQKVSDRFTTMHYRFEAEGHETGGGGWSVVSRPSPYTDWLASSSEGSVCELVLTDEDRFLNGTYWLFVYGNNEEAFSMAIKRKDGSWSSFTPPLTPGLTNGVCFGVVDIGGESDEATPACTLEIKVKNESTSGECHIDYIILAPINKVFGRININTARAPVLRALPGVSEDIANNIETNRPYGLVSGIGDVLTGTVLGASTRAKEEMFKKICNLITVKSDVFEVFVTAQALRKGKIVAEKKLRVVVER